MIYYEMLTLLRPDINQDIYDDIKSKIENLIITDFKGIVKNYDKWGKYLLSYPINKCAYGVYVLIRFGITSEKNGVLEKLRILCSVKFNSSVMRHVIINKGDKFVEIYCKPDSLEDAPRENREEEGEWSNNSRPKYYNKNNNYSKNNTSNNNGLHNSNVIINEEEEDL